MKRIWTNKRWIACVSAVMICLCAIPFSPFIGVKGEVATSYTVPTMSDMLSTCNTWSGNNLLKVTQVDQNGGVRITANGGGFVPDHNMGAKTVFSLDDLTLRFKGYFNSNYFSVRFTSMDYNTSTEWGPGGNYCLRLYMMHDWYDLYYRSYNLTTSQTTEAKVCGGAQRWADLQNKEWTLHFSMNVDGSLHVELGIAGVVTGAGDIPKTALDEHDIDPTKVYLSFGFESSEATTGSIDFTGYSSDYKKAIALIDAIGKVTVDSGDAIVRAKRLYSCVPAQDRALVTNASKLAEAQEQYEQLQKKLLIVPTMEEMLSTCNTWSGNNLLKVTQNDNNGGVHIEANGGFDATNLPDYNMGSKVAYSLNDLTLHFKGYFNSNYFSVRFNSMGYNSESQWGPGGRYCLRLYMMHDWYQLYYRSYNFDTTQQTEAFVCNGAPRWADLQNKNWSLHFLMNEDGSLHVELAIEGTVTGKGDIPKKALDEHDIDPKKVYLSFGFESAEVATGGIDFVGYSNAAFRDVIKAIDEMDTSDRLSILRTSTLYAGLTEQQKEFVYNADVLTAALQTLDSMQESYDAQFTAPTMNDIDGVYPTWPDQVNVRPIETGGLHYTYTNATINMLEGLNHPYCLDGLAIRFANYKAVGGNFAVIFGNKVPNPWPNDTLTGLSVFVDPYKGAICYRPANQAEMPLTNSELLTAENLQNNPWEMAFEKNADGSFTVRVTVYAAVPFLVEAVLPYQALASYATGTMYFSLVSLYNTGEVDFLGVKGTEFPQHVVEEIDAIGTVTADSAEILGKVVSDYRELTERQMPLVTNYEKLQKAVKDYRDCILERDGALPAAVLQVEQKIDAIDMQALSSLTVNGADVAYEELADTDKLLVGNYEKLWQTSRQHQQMIADDVCALLPYYGSSKLLEMHSGAITEQSTAGDIQRFRWNGATAGMLDGTAVVMDIDGLYLKFSRLYRQIGSTGNFALYFSDGVTVKDDRGNDKIVAGWTYERTADHPEDISKCCLALAFDVVNGKMIAYPNGATVMQNDLLKYENLSLKTFSIEINQLASMDYFVELTVEDQTITGTIPASAVRNVPGLFTPNECFVALSSWGNNADGFITEDKQSMVLDFVGLRRGNQEVAVQELIDAIGGTVSTDCRQAIERAETAYAALPEYVKARVNNYNVLTGARFQLDRLTNDNATVAAVEELIDEIGTVTVFSGNAIDAAQEAYLQLTQPMQAKIRNADVLKKAVKQYRKLTDPSWEDDGALYGWAYDAVMSSDYFYSRESLAAYWNDQLTLTNLDNGGMHFNWKNAFRIVRTGKRFGYDLDGLEIKLNNFTKGETEGRVAFLFGTPDTNRYFMEYESGIYNQNSTICLALVLDTVTGELLAYPNRAVVLQSDALKYDNITGKHFTLKFSEMQNGGFLVRVWVDGVEETLSGVLPTGVINAAPMLLDTQDCMVLLSPWVNDKTGRNDSSAHTMAIDVLSVRQREEIRATELLTKVESTIAALDKKVTAANKESVLNAMAEYNSLPTRALRALVSNYAVLANCMEQIHDMEYDAVYAPPETEEETDGSLIDTIKDWLTPEDTADTDDYFYDDSSESEDEPSDENEPSEETDDPEETNTKKSKKAQKSVSKEEDTPWLLWVIIGGAVLVAALIATAAVILIKRRKRNRQS